MGDVLYMGGARALVTFSALVASTRAPGASVETARGLGGAARTLHEHCTNTQKHTKTCPKRTSGSAPMPVPAPAPIPASNTVLYLRPVL